MVGKKETKLVSIEDIMASLDKDTRSKVILANDISTDVLPTASFGLNREIGGGLRVGKQHTFYGAEGSAKSGLLMQTVAVNQRRGEPCVWIDAEHIFDPIWARRLGVDTTKLPVIQASTISEVTDIQVDFIKKGVRLLVIDSTSALMQSSFVENGELKEFDKTAQLGTQAKDLGKMSKMIQAINFSCAIAHISQVRVDIGATGMNKPFIPVGGKEMRHTDALKVRLAGTLADNKQIKDDVQYGDVVVEEIVGYPVTWRVEKNRMNGKIGNGTYNFYKQGEHVGIDRIGEVLAEGHKYGITRAAGAWVYIYDEKFQGSKNAVDYLRENPEVLQQIEDDVNAKSV